ncbi:MAG: 30S ribosomal protein S19 [Euryarchaeota archaeon]|nr:30S ribosomal protein S19 [Euryarchaeota archaeon]MDE1835735.1 30S ribosomal protein S19 [Euryarchaeota archaeon]MDE1880840.1 30S ribosomal protein S19 [Euryarchaeota archaeon]MDE2043926.1 30S ribosomal protein S19 [Thermoplasmata archaeon]
MAKRTKKKGVELRKKKEYALRGKSLEELKALPLPELAKLLPSRIRRTLRRGFNAEQQILVEKLSLPPKGKPVRTHCRDVIVLPRFVGQKVAVFSGKEFKEVEIRPEMIGHYLGEFCLTRRFEKHSGPGVGATRSSKFMPLK